VTSTWTAPWCTWVQLVGRGGRRVRKDTKIHRDRWLAIDPVTCALIVRYLDEVKAELAAVDVLIAVGSSGPAGAAPGCATR